MWASRSAALAVAAVLAACGGKSARPKLAPVANARVGDCADVERAGVVSASPSLRRADRDLDGDGNAEVVVADREMCTGDNCYWNLFADDGAADCRRYLGTVSGFTIDRLQNSGDDGFRSLRGWWRLASGDRYLLQRFEYRRGGYRLVEAMVCRQEDDDRLLCASEQRF